MANEQSTKRARQLAPDPPYIVFRDAPMGFHKRRIQHSVTTEQPDATLLATAAGKIIYDSDTATAASLEQHSHIFLPEKSSSSSSDGLKTWAMAVGVCFVALLGCLLLWIVFNGMQDEGVRLPRRGRLRRREDDVESNDRLAETQAADRGLFARFATSISGVRGENAARRRNAFLRRFADDEDSDDDYDGRGRGVVSPV